MHFSHKDIFDLTKLEIRWVKYDDS